MGGNFAHELKRILLQAGCKFERAGKGDHDIWFSPITLVRFLVRFPVDSKIKSRHTANAVLKRAGLPKKF